MRLRETAATVALVAVLAPAGSASDSRADVTTDAVLLNLGQANDLGAVPCPPYNESCPPNSHCAFANESNVVCRRLEITDCSDGASGDLPAIEAYVQVAPQEAGPDGFKGTVFIHGGGGGKFFMAQNYLSHDAYRNSGFRVIRIAWDSDWQQTAPAPAGVKFAACRVATAVAWARDTWGSNGTKAVCYEGSSGGSMAGSAMMLHYGGENIVDYVTLDTGPPAARIDVSCDEATRLATPPITIPGSCDANFPNGLLDVMDAWWEYYDPVTVSGNGDGGGPHDSYDSWSGTLTCSGEYRTPPVTPSPADVARWAQTSVISAGMDTEFVNSSGKTISVDMYACSNRSLNNAHGGAFMLAEAVPAVTLNCFGDGDPTPGEFVCAGESIHRDVAARALIIDNLNNKCTKN